VKGKLFFLAIFLTFTSSIFAQSPSSFYKAKKLLYKEIYKNHNKTFYCGCSYTGKVVNLESCHYKVRKDTKRAKRVEVEHIVPAYWIAHLTEKGRACWNKGKKLKGISGRKYCEKNNPEFKQAYNDETPTLAQCDLGNTENSAFLSSYLPSFVFGGKCAILWVL
jgi:deoxyribonuclease-1